MRFAPRPSDLAGGLLLRLLPLLHDADPFVRFCASESLRHLTGREMAVDWMYGPASERAAAAAEMERLHEESR